MARANSPPLKKLNLRIAVRGNSMKKLSSSPIKIVTAGTINRSISIRPAGIWYETVISSARDEAFIVHNSRASPQLEWWNVGILEKWVLGYCDIAPVVKFVLT